MATQLFRYAPRDTRGAGYCRQLLAVRPRLRRVSGDSRYYFRGGGGISCASRISREPPSA